MIFDGGARTAWLLEYKRLEALIGIVRQLHAEELRFVYFDESVVNCRVTIVSPPVVQDYTEIAKLLISAVSETGQYFGVSHIIDGCVEQKLQSKGSSPQPVECIWVSC